MGTENRESCSQRDSAERKGYVRAHRSFNRIWKERDSAEPDILSKILNKENLNRAYKRVKANKGAPGVDGMTIEAALPWLRENNYELVERIRKGKYTPISSQACGDSEAGGRDTKAWYPHGNRPYHPAGNASTAHANLRTIVLERQLRLSSGTRSKRRHSQDKGVYRTGIHEGSSSRLIEIL